ncbi:hypothetical protein A2011_02580 [candidate division CPR3 bacterium GWE2_35_7]|nr:MAG: polymerase protein [candidate division CPR3 bacterium GW2011_GWE2_35_7]OGB79720.1 MAG: hypothetical protein A2011_02580 [candidate division CPR3 bacterium GWE2_35_7]
MNDSKIVIFDAHALIHRAYHALPPLTTSEGIPINAVYGFVKIVLNILETMSPNYVAVAFDTRTPTFRHVDYSEYKANRPPSPDDLKIQFPIVKQIVEDLGLSSFEVEGYEADDVIGASVNKFEKSVSNSEIFIVTGDFDATQLVNDHIKIFTLGKRIENTSIWSKKDLMEKFQLSYPKQIIDYKALRGDPSDNIPGVKGIGEKTASILLKNFKNLETIYENIDKVESKYRQKLVDDRTNAFLSKKLATIISDVPLSFKVDECKYHSFDREKIVPVLEKYEFRSLIKKFTRKDISKTVQKKDENEQLSFIE